MPYYQGIVDQTPPDQIATTTWATCQHSGQTQAVNFFGWHRMYLYYFEQVLRWAAQDTTLRLPYWDYTDPAQLALPQPYRVTTAALYDGKRNPDVNSGAATLSSLRTNINNLLNISTYFTYESRIEEGIHGYVHCTVGPTCPVAHMGDVPVAGNDPIFYSHHANIDRMWACWQNLYPTPAGTWQDQQFSFPDATGTLQTKPVKEFLDSTKLGYVYDNSTQCRRGAVAKAGGPGKAAKGKMLGAKQNVAVDEPLLQLAMEMPAALLKSAMAELAPAQRIGAGAARRDRAEPAGRVVRRLRQQEKRPQKSPAGRHHPRFWIVPPRPRAAPGAAADHGHETGGMMAHTFEFDVTDAVRLLGDADLMVEIEATDGRTMVDPAKAEAARKKAAADFRATAKVKIGAVEVRIAAATTTPKADPRRGRGQERGLGESPFSCRPGAAKMIS